MSKIVTIQNASFVDNVVDGREFFKKPYPFSIDAEGYIQFQDFWQGTVYRVVGFQSHPDVYSIDLYWEDAFADPESMIGLYLITSSNKGGVWSTHTTPVESYFTSEDVSA